MPYEKISDRIQKLTNPQRSDTFLKIFKEAVRTGEIEAAYTGERFTLPKNYSRRGSDEGYQRSAREMIFECTPKFEKWFEETNRDLTPSRKGGSTKPSLETIEAGMVDFQALAQATRQKMLSNYKKGQTLGTSRAKNNKNKK